MKSDFLEGAVFYEVYPTSFYDSNGDGIGDIRGIIEKLDYITGLGANGIWLNPCFESPFKDGGYDVSDYYKTDGRFGSNDDLNELFSEAGKRGISIILDLVMGHTSIEHPWFNASQRDEKNPYTDAYIWKPLDNPAESKGGSFLSGLSERREMFRINYYAMQPALNYGYLKPKEGWQQGTSADGPTENKNRLIDVCKFWLGMGASGFRVDMANYMVKNDKRGRGNIAFWNEVIPKIKEEYPNAVFVSEWFNPIRSVGKSAFDIDFNSGYFLYYIWHGGVLENFSRNAYFGENGKHFFSGIIQVLIAAAAVKKRGYQAVTLGNHDRERMALGRSVDAMKAVFAFHLTLPHVPFVYYGDEIGMKYQTIKSKDGGYQRTGSRTPMRWDDGINAGFSRAGKASLYLPVGDGEGASVAEQERDKTSLLSTVKSLIALRRKAECLKVDSKFRLVKPTLTGNPFIYKRESEKDEAVIILCPIKKEKAFSIRKLGDISGYDTVISNNIEFKDGKAVSKGEGFAVLYREKKRKK